MQKPTKGDIWPAYTTQRIQWISSNVDNIKIESSLDSGRTWNLIVASYPAAAEYYDWEVPFKISDSCYIRVTDVLNASTTSSNFRGNPFRIPPPFLKIDTVSSNYFSGTVIPITWNFSGIKRINLFIGYGTNQIFKKIADTVSAKMEYFNWNLNDSISSNCYIRIEDATNPSISDTTKIPFAISRLPAFNTSKYRGGSFDGHSTRSTTLPKLTLQTPNNKDSLVGGIEYIVSWVSANIDLIRIEYTLDNGQSWIAVANSVPAGAGMYKWSVPRTSTSLGRIRITDVADSSNRDESDSTFVIRQKQIKLTSPLSNDIINAGTAFPISWDIVGVNKVRISYLTPTRLLADSVLGSFEVYNWIVPDLVDSFRIIICDIDNPAISDTSAWLKLRKLPSVNLKKYSGGGFDGHTYLSNRKPRLTLISPNSGEKFIAAAEIPLRWYFENIEFIDIYLSVDSLKSWIVQAEKIPASLVGFKLKLPNITASNCFIKLVNKSDSLIVDTSDSSFSISSKKLINTTDSLDWKVDLVKQITWETIGVDTISIDYKISSKDSKWNTIAQSYPSNAEVFNWVVPKAFDSLWIRIADKSDTTLSSILNFHGKIPNTKLSAGSVTKTRGGKFDGHSFRSNLNKIIIRRPIANEIIVSGNSYTINWSTVNVTDSVMLQFSIDSGKTWIMIGSTIAVNGLYIWNIPSVLTGIGGNSSDSMPINSNNCLLRAIDMNSTSEVVGMSTSPFTIKSSTSKLLNRVSFTKPRDMRFPDSTTQKLQATASSGKRVQYFVTNTMTAKISVDTFVALKAGKITVGAYDLGDSNYQKSDTVYYTFCINPAKPVITVKQDKIRFCSGDSSVLSGPPGFSKYSWSNGDSTEILVVNKSLRLTLQVGMDNCISLASDTIRLSSELVNKPTITVSNSLLLQSSPANKYQWYRNNQKIDSAIRQEFVPPISGSYQVQVFNDIDCNNISDVLNFIPTAIVPLSNQVIGEMMQISPNPVSGNQVNIQFRLNRTSEISILIYDNMGKGVYSSTKKYFQGINSINIELPILPNGIYTVVLRSGQMTTSKKLIIGHLNQ